MKTIVKENTWLARVQGLNDFGWGNGYVVIPPGHPCHGVHYDDLDVDAHGGLTFSELASNLDWPELTEEDKDCWVVGFDTAHAWDTLERWTPEAVQAEADRLREQLEALS